ncbi:MAG: dehypoxanthine futalosine cyclase [Nitrospirae bacterium RIFOXYB2_FULL_43_5]|nr:MAG: dehypoxanthine futalosine cyclase [Nitrospirae bacterium GWF2_44_13]OGW63274.1 MAG: dehypoxanthine futalosine cyclase [Nitrospirae bacterium RIFOXYA2_FULL_44_9]OGW75113.1 MAG: dehypoxanthine futalosine cyclase [Nitrospirae bacterium RIFOXYB2_FULL_43_5]HBG92192.1 dehypoxanthine futalosine cyclase [Nitrospiraceae bacterium]HBU05238.1 dehypoxanthine futalosine cyclase [Nitrospiraceae bacterium]
MNKHKRITKSEGLELLKNSDLLDLGQQADGIREKLHPEKTGTFIVDRNINYTNICINKCTFCAFWRDKENRDAYVLSEDELFRKIEETIRLGGTQILIQGGLHPDFNIEYYINLLKSIKSRFDINVHGFSPPEICYIADKSDLTIREALRVLKSSGLDSIPGGGAEILSDRVREILSPRKIKSSSWLKVMEEAHRLGMRTTATMMFGSVEKPEDIIEHLDAIRNLQDRTKGFTAFIPWTFQPGNTELAQKSKGTVPDLRTEQSEVVESGLSPCGATAVEYLRVLALSRIYLDNIKNIQASWVTQGLKIAEVALRFGANDFGSTMIEENVVASAGVSYRVSKEDIIRAIKNAGFTPAQRDTYYNIIKRF